MSIDRATHMQAPIETTTSGDFEIQKLSREDYRLIPSTAYTNRAFVFGAAAVTVTVTIPFHFQIMRLVYEHNTGTIGTDSTDTMGIILERPTGGIVDIPNLQDRFWREEDITDARGGVDFSKHKLRFPAGKLDMIINSTDTDLLLCELYVMRLY